MAGKTANYLSFIVAIGKIHPWSFFTFGSHRLSL